jgi:hypothetical protein
MKKFEKLRKVCEIRWKWLYSENNNVEIIKSMALDDK